MKKLAIFDIDGTIFRSSFVIELTEALIQAGVFPERTEEAYKKAYRNWLDRKDNYGKYISAVVKAFGKHIKGQSVKRVNGIAERVVRFHKDRVYRYTRDLVKELRKKNYYVIAISHSPEQVVRSFCKNFGFNEVFGTIYSSAGGKFTGEQTRASKYKDGILKLILRNKKFSLRGSVGVGDTEGDVPFLKMVQNPICFNPNSKLYRVARRNGWKVVVERKDVTYFLD